MSLQQRISQLTRRARGAARRLASLDTQTKNRSLLRTAEALQDEGVLGELMAANEKDLSAGRDKGLSGALLDRLALDKKRSVHRGMRLTDFSLLM